MNEQEQKAIKWIQNVRDDAVVTLDHIAKNEPNVNPMLYAGRKERAETIIKVFEELERYRAIGTVDEFKALKENWLNKFDSLIEYRKIGTPDELKQLKENGAFTGVELAQLAAIQMKLKEYQQIGTVEEIIHANAVGLVEHMKLKEYEAIGTVEECRAAVEKQKEVRNKAIDEAIAKVSEYASIWMSYNDGMTREQIAQGALNSSKCAMIRILEQLKEVE